LRDYSREPPIEEEEEQEEEEEVHRAAVFL
jgi:hypothetical protein